MKHRIWIVYRKELVDALRDKRTLMAMIVVPVVLYPVLMMAVVQALQIEQSRLAHQRYAIAVPDAAHADWLRHALQAAQEQPASRATAPAAAPPGRAMRVRIGPSQFDIAVCTADAKACINDMKFQVYLTLTPPPVADETNPPNRTIHMTFDAAEVISQAAQQSLSDILGRYGDRLRVARLERHGLKPDMLTPLVFANPVNASTQQKLSGALFGQILPALLVIFTAVGAFYPVIDLTAGERERGTLETLLSAPVPLMQIVAGKFLVVVTVAVVVALLNLTSMGATVQFTGLAQAMARAMANTDEATTLPIRSLPIVLIAMLPFAVLISGVMLAACSFARTFKEAQNYVTPVVIGALLPAMMVAYMPSLKLTPTLAIIPVVNIVALVRELFLGKNEWGFIALVTASTCLYAAAAVGVAARLYGKESVIFSDVGSYRSLLSRRFIRPAARPTAATALLLVAIIFPIQFYFQSGLVRLDTGEPEAAIAARFRLVMVACQLLVYLLPVLALTWYLRLDWRETLSLRRPSAGGGLGSVLIAAGIVPALSLIGHLQRAWFGSQGAGDAGELEQRLIGGGTLTATVLAFGVLPGICEEILFRGFLLSGLRDRLRPAALCISVGVLFGLYHVYVIKMLPVALMGILLAFVCWRTGSILPAILIHVVNNGLALAGAKIESLARFLGQTDEPGPAWVRPAAFACVLAGIAVIAASRRPRCNGGAPDR